MKPKLDLATVAGIIAGLGLIILAIFLGGGAGLFFNVPSILIVIGGTIAATLINFPLKEVMSVLKVTPKAFKSSFDEPTRIMERLVSLCGEAKKQGLLGLESHAKSIDNPFFRSALNMVIDGSDPDTVKSTLGLQTMAMQERHRTGRRVFESMGQWAPAFGMIGTLIGLVQMMASMDDPKALGPKMAVALLTTFYGAVMANLLFLPMAGKLKRLSEIELTTNKIIVEGISGILKGTTPMLLEGRLKSFLETSKQEEEIKRQPVGAG